MNIIFDFGDVLIQWDIYAAYKEEFATRADCDAFIDASGFHGWNVQQDGGRSFADAVVAARQDMPEHAELLSVYLERFDRTIQTPVPGTWEILEELRAKGHRIFGLTNWAADTYPIAVQTYPALGTAFEDVVVSGQESLLKPQAEIYQLLLGRNDLAASDCVFIDDSPKNIAGAQAVGIDGIVFTGAAALRTALQSRGLL